MASTITALSTPYGRSGIGVIRLSGGDALKIISKLTKSNDFKPRVSSLRKIYDLSNDDVIDSALITYFQSPQSFTGEDVIEISSHGSPVLLRQIVDSCVKLDARLATAGEFTLRALANGKMNLSQAEAVRDLIDASTLTAAKQAAKQLNGELSNQLQPLKDDLLNVIVFLESTLEFVEDDLPETQTDKIKSNLTEISAKLENLAATYKVGKLIREGLRVALIGRPNVGKSSLFNALLGSERAIVTEIAGTTRDALREQLTIKNVAVSLIDTAGIRETNDVVEKIGVTRTKQTIADADMVVVILDGTQLLKDDDLQILRETENTQRLIVVNKSDLPTALDFSETQTDLSIVKISAKTGFGLNEMQTAIIAPFASSDLETSNFLISDARHFDLLNRSHNEITASIDLFNQNYSEEIVLVGLHNALRYLGEITGETTTEDVLTRIFSTFCIGK
ncbi:MAG: tRNA uridine-5-carboxymethylaminomethyl(34) synthesis GTPase MnmE [Pyrinomonadaceae bacterium]|nr:tRNA uridine-5-carboxymethylaminomethyl(34) synthesis GTPase MnmE [Pyrinomonadaceae bacterium]